MIPLLRGMHLGHCGHGYRARLVGDQSLNTTRGNGGRAASCWHDAARYRKVQQGAAGTVVETYLGVLAAANTMPHLSDFGK